MALYRYFKSVPKKLPDPDGPLSESIPSASIQDANEAYLKAAARSEVSKRKSYIRLTGVFWFEITTYTVTIVFLNVSFALLTTQRVYGSFPI